jgi:NAD(P)-dependent dehydrogenase (short-subunit alcohol dehydrogenase family)
MATWLITGANRGIGLEFVRQALRAGHEVIAAVRDPHGATALDDLRGQGALDVLRLDVSDPASFQEAARALGERPVSVLVNNAGVIGPKRQSALDMDYEGFARTLEVNLFGPLRAIQTFLPNLERAGSAKVATISSLMGSIENGGSYQLAYSASKAALNRLLRGATEELKRRGVALGVYSPGWVRTDMGGANASISVEQSVGGLMARIEELDGASAGRFVNWDGKTLPW